jgi:hypothetical protein
VYQITIKFIVEKQNPDLNLNILYKVESFFIPGSHWRNLEFQVSNYKEKRLLLMFYFSKRRLLPCFHSINLIRIKSLHIKRVGKNHNIHFFIIMSILSNSQQNEHHQNSRMALEILGIYPFLDGE